MCLKYKNIFKNLNIWEQNFFVKKFLSYFYTQLYKSNVCYHANFFSDLCDQIWSEIYS
jgi:hypothetical protein